MMSMMSHKPCRRGGCCGGEDHGRQRACEKREWRAEARAMTDEMFDEALEKELPRWTRTLERLAENDD